MGHKKTPGAGSGIDLGVHGELALEPLAAAEIASVGQPAAEVLHPAALAACEDRSAAERAFNDAVLDAAPGFFYTMDRDGRLVRLNRALASALHVTPATGAGIDPFALIGPEDEARGRAALDHIFETGSGEVQLPIPVNGEVRQVLMTARRVDIAGAPYCVGFGIDVTDRARMEDELRQTRDQLEHRVEERTAALTAMNDRLKRTERALLTLSWSNQTLVRSTNSPRLLQDVCDAAREVGGYKLAWVGYADDDDAKTVRPVAWSGVDEDFFDRLHVSWEDGPEGQGAVGRCIRDQRPVHVSDTGSDPCFAPWRDLALEQGYGSCVGLPLINREGHCFGALALYAAETDAFDDREVALLQELAMDLAFGLDSLEIRAKQARAEEELRESYARLEAMTWDVAESMGRVVEARDPYTQGHERRVSRLCKLIAHEMGLPPDESAAVEMAALLHDIGKLGVPSEILTKPGTLSRTEFALIKDHSYRGYEILKGIAFPWPIADIVLQHHERMDGSGYPSALKGDEISVSARILAVADVVEAMASHRPYRPAIGLAEAIAEIAGNEAAYDPAVVEACCNLYERGAIEF
jgi:putative nucleotidyltransferase with HDIG domain/PAS domain S-box-containing protein